jgi:L-alanine-DL-glutamate epimerase-like enolase superfamily enzyme
MRRDISPEEEAGRVTTIPDKAIEIGRMLEQQKVIQFEEPCPWWEMEWTKEVTDNLTVPVSGGEQDNNMAQWRRMIKSKSIDIVQPDILYLGGVSRTIRVAKMAEEKGLTCVPHAANHGLATLYALHLLGAIPNAQKYLEYSIEFNAGVNKEAYTIHEPHLKVVGGAIQIPSEPGWGLRIKKEWIEKADYQKSEVRS